MSTCAPRPNVQRIQVDGFLWLNCPLPLIDLKLNNSSSLSSYLSSIFIDAKELRFNLHSCVSYDTAIFSQVGVSLIMFVDNVTHLILLLAKGPSGSGQGI